MAIRNSHCTFCGASYALDQPWPRRCAACGNTSYQNPLPVAVMVLPVDEGLLVIRRAIEPRLGQLALPGGFIDIGESWQQAAARELFEETGIEVSAADVTLFDVLSAPDGTVLVFGRGPALSSTDLPVFTPTPETSEWLVVKEPQELAFPLHSQVMAAYFAAT
ncbi:NUDIX domain-containing protein [Herbidospora cretacea]|uniref:NUDIX domain-containing protein n=1 Tax=Herbidospora cretacea TaxID=28444 RepID=UPI0005582A7E|nr:NUDIX domain-containing protein [Herbidospora cretacea]